MPNCLYLPTDKMENNIRKIASLTMFSEKDRKFPARSKEKISYNNYLDKEINKLTA